MTRDTVLKHTAAHPLRNIFMGAHFSFMQQEQGRRKYALPLLMALLQQIWNSPKAECQGWPGLIRLLWRCSEEMAEKVTRCLKHKDVRTKELLSGGSGVETEMHPVSLSRTKLQCYRRGCATFHSPPAPLRSSWPLVLHCQVAFWNMRFRHQGTLWQCHPCLWNKTGN